MIKQFNEGGEVMRCSKCGAELEDFMLECPECGAKVYSVGADDIKKAPEENRWYWILDKVMGMPGVTVDRESFLSGWYSKYYDEAKVKLALEKGVHVAGVPVERIDEIADKIIGKHKTLVTGASALAGLPGGFALLGTVPADIAQYYYHALQVAQKLAYLYGYPDLKDDDLLLSMTIFIGVMSGAAAADQGIKQLAKHLSEKLAAEAVERAVRIGAEKTIGLTGQILMRSAIYPIAKQSAKALGARVTKEVFAKAAAKAIPLVGAAASGSLTYVMFSREASRLKKELRGDFLAKQESGGAG
jgi:hypothetical protein